MNAYRTLLAVGLLMLPLAAQEPADDQAVQQQVLAPEQLESMVAPIALYPASLLSQVLVASTYPLEVVEAGQWLQQNSRVDGDGVGGCCAKQQSWDPQRASAGSFCGCDQEADVRHSLDY